MLWTLRRGRRSLEAGFTKSSNQSRTAAVGEGIRLEQKNSYRRPRSLTCEQEKCQIMIQKNQVQEDQVRRLHSQKMFSNPCSRYILRMFPHSAEQLLRRYGLIPILLVGRKIQERSRSATKCRILINNCISKITCMHVHKHFLIKRLIW